MEIGPRGLLPGMRSSSLMLSSSSCGKQGVSAILETFLNLTEVSERKWEAYPQSACAGSSPMCTCTCRMGLAFCSSTGSAYLSSALAFVTASFDSSPACACGIICRTSLLVNLPSKSCSTLISLGASNAEASSGEASNDVIKSDCSSPSASQEEKSTSPGSVTKGRATVAAAVRLSIPCFTAVPQLLRSCTGNA